MRRSVLCLFVLVTVLFTLAGCNKGPSPQGSPDATEESVDTILPSPPPETDDTPDARPETEDVPNTPPEPSLPLIHEAKVSVLPHGTEAAQMHAWFSGSKAYYFFYESGKENMEFYRVQNLYSRDEYIEKLTLTLPNGYYGGSIVRADTTSGGYESDGIRFIVSATHNGGQVYLNYTLSADKASGYYVLTSVSETTEEEFTPTLGDRTLEFVAHSLYTQVGATVSLSVPAYWEIGYYGSGNGYIQEEDVLNILPYDTTIKRSLFNTVDTDFDAMLAELSNDTYSIGDTVISGTTVSGYEYKGVSVDMHKAYRHIFRITTEREIYNFEVWEWPAYDEGIDFLTDVVIPVVESFSVEYHEEEAITDIADWDSLPWVEEPRADGKRAQNIYNFIYDMVSGESKYPEINGLGIRNYSITLLENASHESTVRFTFTVTGNSLPQTLPPGTHTKIISVVMYMNLYDNKKPETQEEYTAADNIQRGLDKYGDIPAVLALHKYLCFPNMDEIPDHGDWPSDTYSIPYPYICAYYGNKNLEISFDLLQQLLLEKFGISVERPDDGAHLYSCEYNKETDTVRYSDTRGYNSTHRFVDVTESDGITYVTVQFYADDFYLIPSYKIVYKIGEGDIFLGCEVLETGNYKPHSIGW